MTHDELVKRLEDLQAQLNTLLIKVRESHWLPPIQPLSGGGPGEEK